ncbi:MAG TPA: ubiquinol-cytochrome c reductase iron-sulfur subunit [Terriglobales bacterium]|jgi:cytochrome b6-f complex iron-sulfur subunit|nr:ubiquinol-cytochrome c reductase iron-sulfur subunit [Terriglobales bacterium]
MPEEKNNPQNQPAEMSRRRFFVRMGVGSIAVATLGSGVFGYQFMSPNVLFEPSLIVNAGKPEEYEVNSVTFDPKNSIYVMRDAAGFYAVSAVCTHLGCVTAWKPELDMIACPCHGSKFHKDGTKIEGPAPKPLPWLRMWISEEGNLMVDRGTTVQARQFVRV